MSIAKLETTKPADHPLRLQSLTIFGKEGSGKSGLAADIPNHIYLDLETKRFTRKPITRFPTNSWQAITEFIDAIWNGDTTYDGHTFIVDTVAELYRLAVKHGLALEGLTELPAKNTHKKSASDIGRAILDDFEKYINTLLMLSRQSRLGVVFICHEFFEKQSDGVQELTIARPDAGNGVLRPWFDQSVNEWMTRRVQMVFRTFVTDVHPVTMLPFGKPTYLTQTKPDNQFAIVKDATDRFPQYVPTSWKALENAYKKADAVTKETK